MNDSDRAVAIRMYEDMFSKASDEHALWEHLVSPTRQAVVIARAYNSSPRRLSDYGEGKPDEDTQSSAAPGYVQAIDKVSDEARGKGIIEEVNEDQLTLFADEDAPQAESKDAQDEPAAEAESAESAAAPVPEDAPAPEQAQGSAEAKMPDEDSQETEAAVEQSQAEAAVQESQSEDASEAAGAAQSDAAQSQPPAEAKSGDAVDEFIKDFSIAPQVEKAAAPKPQHPFKAEDAPVSVTVTGKTERRVRVFPLILYIIAAIPLTLLGIAVLLIPTVLFLAVAAAAIASGGLIFSAAFGGFSVFADIMAVVGGAIVLLALGLLCLWTFIWFVGGAIAGLVRGVFALGGKWCYKEVQV